jgi:hypothetical protein
VQGFSPARAGRPKGLHYFVIFVIFMVLDFSLAGQQPPPARSVWDGV